jgi:hypothetical protein
MKKACRIYNHKEHMKYVGAVREMKGFLSQSLGMVKPTLADIELEQITRIQNTLMGVTERLRVARQDPDEFISPAAAVVPTMQFRPSQSIGIDDYTVRAVGTALAQIPRRRFPNARDTRV